MLKVGLTGGIASGKSLVSQIFIDLGAHCIDADEIAHNLDPDATRNEVTRRMMAQATLEAKIQAADFVIDNSGSIEETRKQIDDVYRKLASKATARTA